MDIVDEVIEKIRSDPQIRNARFSNKFLNTVGEMCSRYGYGATRLFLLGRDENEARALLKVLDILEECSFLKLFPAIEPPPAVTQYPFR